MNKQIWKYELRTKPNQIIEMPKYAEILTVQLQRGQPCIWALVDPKQPKEDRYIQIFGTGNPILTHPGVDGLTYINTYQSPQELLVFHVFEISISQTTIK